VQHDQDRPARRTSGSTHRARPASATQASTQQHSAGPAGAIGMLPYLLVLAGVIAGLLLTWYSSRYAGKGTGLVGGALLAAALARLALPPRYAGLLASRRKAPDVLAFAVLGAGILGFALWLP
jgi:hypothetical protein